MKVSIFLDLLNFSSCASTKERTIKGTRTDKMELNTKHIGIELKLEYLLSDLQHTFSIRSYEEEYDDLIKMSQDEWHESGPYERKLMGIISYMYSENNETLSYDTSSLMFHFFQIYEIGIFQGEEESTTVSLVSTLYDLIKCDQYAYSSSYDVILVHVVTEYIFQRDLSFSSDETETVSNLSALIKTLHNGCVKSQNYFKERIYEEVYKSELKFDYSVVLKETSKIIRSLREDLEEIPRLKSLFFISYNRLVHYYMARDNDDNGKREKYYTMHLRYVSLMLYTLVKYVSERTKDIVFIHSADLKSYRDTVTSICEKMYTAAFGVTTESLEKVKMIEQLVETRLKQENKSPQKSKVYKNIQIMLPIIIRCNPDLVSKLYSFLLDKDFEYHNISFYHNFSLFAQVVDSFTN